MWEGWADWLGVPRFTFLAALGGVIERREHHMAVFELFRPGFDLATERAARNEAGVLWAVEERDLYPDVRPALERLRAYGFLVGISGNQPEAATPALRALHLPVDLIENSADWGVKKPDPEFLSASRRWQPRARTHRVRRRPPRQRRAPRPRRGMASVFLRRGPWGLAHDRRPRRNSPRPASTS